MSSEVETSLSYLNDQRIPRLRSDRRQVRVGLFHRIGRDDLDAFAPRGCRRAAFRSAFPTGVSPIFVSTSSPLINLPNAVY